MNRVYNFGAGPAILPVEVLEEAAGGVLEFGESGMSILEVSHRSKRRTARHSDSVGLVGRRVFGVVCAGRR
jgi:phosphoserine aminotransferase